MVKVSRAASATLAEDRKARSARAAAAFGVLAVGIGVYQAARLAWTTDDAYISFRYARNLTNGLGLVYNAGERVEGYSNFLWTLWCAAGLRLGISPEAWANVWGIIFFAGTIAMLAALTVRRARSGRAFAVVPIAALAVALHHDACVFATGGLETSFFTFLVLLGYVVLARIGTEQVDRSDGAEAAPGGRDVRDAAAGALVLGLASLTRPDGAVFAALGTFYVPWAARRRLGATLAYVAILAAIGVPYAAWKLAYYGDLLPNTFYAKSAGAAWWDQGLVYLGLYARRYSVLIAAPVVAVCIAVAGARREAGVSTGVAGPAPVEAGPMLLAATFAIAYTLAVVRVGGDFMFARLLIPATPLYALTLEYAIVGLGSDARGGAALPAITAAASLCVVAFSPDPVRADAMVRGVANEREFYKNQRYTDRKAMGEDLLELTRGLPVRVVISGTQAIVGYYSQAPVLIEASTGLTDRRTAHLTLQSRGRVGHEKNAPLAYLIEDRRAHLEVGSTRLFDDSVSAYVPLIHLSYKSLKATLLTWDPTIMAEFRRRGATFAEFLPGLDRFLETMASVPNSVVAAAYDQTKRFYFSGTQDSVRESAFIRRLAHPQPVAAPAPDVPRTGS